MSGRPPADDDRDLDVWVQQVTETWRPPALRSDQLPWQARLRASGSNVGADAATRSHRMSAARVVGTMAAAAVLALAAVMLVTSLPVPPGTGPGGPGRDVAASPSSTAVPSSSPAPLGEGRDDRFALTIRADRAVYAEDEPIEILTTLRHLGDEPVTVTSSGGGLVGFSIEQLDGPLDTGIARESDCVRFDYGPGEVESVDFQKSGGYSSDDPMADFWRTFFADPELRLPAGEYRITAVAEYGDVDCGRWGTIDASIVIVVE